MCSGVLLLTAELCRNLRDTWHRLRKNEPWKFDFGLMSAPVQWPVSAASGRLVVKVAQFWVLLPGQSWSSWRKTPEQKKKTPTQDLPAAPCLHSELVWLRMMLPEKEAVWPEEMNSFCNVGRGHRAENEAALSLFPGDKVDKAATYFCLTAHRMTSPPQIRHQTESNEPNLFRSKQSDYF